jgi:hypothetical protein
MFDFYLLVDFVEKRILTPIDYLPEDWSNINGLNLFDEEKLSNLEWAGHNNLGWVKYTDSQIDDYETSDNWLDSSKSKIKLLIAKKRWVLSTAEFLELFEFVSNYIQECFNVEYNTNQLVNSISSFSELKQLNFDLNWPSVEL